MNPDPCHFFLLFQLLKKAGSILPAPRHIPTLLIQLAAPGAYSCAFHHILFNWFLFLFCIKLEYSSSFKAVKQTNKHNVFKKAQKVLTFPKKAVFKGYQVQYICIS